MVKIGLIQMTSGANIEDNFEYIARETCKLTKQGAVFVTTPENALLFSGREQYHRYAETLGSGEIQTKLATLAKSAGCWLHIGSFPIKSGNDVTTTSLIFSPMGELVGHYSKLHMFDVDVADSYKSYRESDCFAAGDFVSTVSLPFAKCGLTICYDVRFPSLFQKLRAQGANLIVVPAAFTAVTGQAHWEVLLRARAIETQCWVIGVGQAGTHPCGRTTHGHSMVVSPWGDIVHELDESPTSAVCDIALEQTEQIRQDMPVMEHARFVVELKEEPNNDD